MSGGDHADASASLDPQPRVGRSRNGTITLLSPPPPATLRGPGDSSSSVSDGSASASASASGSRPTSPSLMYAPLRIDVDQRRLESRDGSSAGVNAEEVGDEDVTDTETERDHMRTPRRHGREGTDYGFPRGRRTYEPQGLGIDVNSYSSDADASSRSDYRSTKGKQRMTREEMLMAERPNPEREREAGNSSIDDPFNESNGPGSIKGEANYYDTLAAASASRRDRHLSSASYTTYDVVAELERQGPAFTSSSSSNQPQNDAFGRSDEAEPSSSNLLNPKEALQRARSARVKWSALHPHPSVRGVAPPDEDEAEALVGSAGSTRHGRRQGDLEMGQGAGTIQPEERSYPPLSEEELEERRIQENLARFAAKDMARRRAARASKLYGAGPSNQSASPSFSGSGSSNNKRQSGFGFLKLPSILSGARDSQDPRRTSQSSITEQHSPYAGMSPQSRQYSSNPFDQPYASNRSESPTAARTLAVNPSPTRETQPGIDKVPTPIMPEEQHPDIHRSGSTLSLIEAPGGVVFDNDDGIEGWGRHAPSRKKPGNDPYQPNWRMDPNNYQANVDRDGFTHVPNMKQERWWSALCAWGDELDDGGVDGQAGRTNPFE